MLFRSVLANLEAPASVLRCLVQIDMGEVVGKDLKGVRGWREVSKLATGIAGSEDMGPDLLQAGRRSRFGERACQAKRKEQRRHIERLRSV